LPAIPEARDVADDFERNNTEANTTQAGAEVFNRSLRPSWLEGNDEFGVI
jgi:hypothetical protein